MNHGEQMSPGSSVPSEGQDLASGFPENTGQCAKNGMLLRNVTAMQVPCGNSGRALR